MSARESIIPVFVPHLGCPHACVFCNQRRISGSSRPATAEDVICAVEKAAALPHHGAKRQLAFYGGSFTAIPAAQQLALLRAARTELDRGNIHSIRLSTRPDAIDDAILTRLEQYGVETIELGAQSMDENVLRLAGRGHTGADVERAARLIKERGFRLILQMMTGLPGATKESDLSTAKQLAPLNPDGVRIFPTAIVRDTALYDLWQAGKYQEHTVEAAVETCARLLPVFEDAGIPVIRLGLNPTEELSAGAAVAGAYHPALGELVQSRLMLQAARRVLAEVPPHSAVTLAVARGKISQMTGQHRQNVAALCREFGLRSLKIKETDLKGREIQIFSLEISGDI